jgi:hypothetical protein
LSRFLIAADNDVTRGKELLLRAVQMRSDRQLDIKVEGDEDFSELDLLYPDSTESTDNNGLPSKLVKFNEGYLRQFNYTFIVFI